MSIDKIIAIDGPSGVGKGTLAANLADYYSLPHLDTGLMYRWIAFEITKTSQTKSIDSINSNDGYLQLATSYAASLDISHLVLRPPQSDNSNWQIELRNEEVAQLASEVAKIASVRSILSDKQQKLIHQLKELVLDGRDTTSVICPNSPFRFYLDADIHVRSARRRMQETQGDTSDDAADAADADYYKQSMQQRDTRDSSRKVAPLNILPDVCFIDTTHLSADEVFKKALEVIQSKMKMLKS